MKDKIKIAAVQMEPKIMDIKGNLKKILLKTREAAKKGADLVVFPECALTGYVFKSRAEAVPYAETIPGKSTDAVAGCCKELGVYTVFGLMESSGDKLFNAAVLVGTKGLIGKYRKNHLPFLGVDRFLDPGDEPFRIHKTPIGNIGMHICYDCNFPETARVMTLQGADILVLPTNWPEGRGKVAKYVIVTRAYENRVHLVAVDRVGVERGTRFIGLSKIINSWGDVLAEAGGENEETIYGDVSLAEAREKRLVFKEGEFVLDFIGHRRPELYKKLSQARLPKAGS